ncbi:MAG: GAF domain-containing protein, partial [Anaerolineae bacterium]
MSAQPTKLDAARLARMVEVSRILNSTTDVDTLLTFIIKEAAAMTHTEAASILLLDPNTRQLFIKASSNDVPPEMATTPVPLDSSIAGAILQTNQPLYIPDVSADPRWNQEVDEAIEFRTREILGVPMRDVDKEPIGVLEAINKLEGSFSRQDAETLAVLADLAGVAVEKAHLFNELQRANTELNELDQIKSDFISIASHELRTPLSVILGYVSFLREEAGPEMATQMDSVLDAAIHLRNLIQDMLNFRYVAAGTSALNLEMVDLAQLIRELNVDEDETAVAKQQTININFPPFRLSVEADRDMMQVVMDNLIGNAIKFTPKNGRIDISITRQGQECWLTVSDTGIGIPE